MSASKVAGPDGLEKRDPRSGGDAPPEADCDGARPEESALVQEKVLAEITHELGNFFHKLYYWSDYLKEKPARQPADSTAAQMLESTIRNLEGFLKMSLDYFHPTQLSFTRMRAADLLEGLLFQARAHLNGTPVGVSGQGAWNDAEVLVDPGHLSRAFEVAARHLTKEVGAESAVEIRVARARHHDRPGLEVEFQVERPNEASPLFRTAEAGVEWAVAQKVVALHGGALEEITAGPAGKRIVVFLPVCPG